MREYLFTVSEDMEGERIDKCIPLLLEDVSRSYVSNLIKEGHVLLNGKGVKASSCVKMDDTIFLSLPEQILPDIEPENIPLSILYEDEDVLIVNKPKGMVVHPAAGHYSGTLVNALMYYLGDDLSGINGVLRPGIVHRIDRDTTGSIIVCKNDFAHRSLADQLKEHSIERAYEAIVIGRLKEETGTIHKCIGRSPQDRKKMAIVPSGKDAITHYKLLHQYDKYAHIECRLETGRTHQIRVHMSSIGYPLLGDSVYTNASWPYHLEGQCLHARTLGFTHPRSGERIVVEAPLPEYFTHLLSIFH